MEGDKHSGRDRRDHRDNHLIIVIIFVVVIAVGLSVATLFIASSVRENTDAIGQLERKDSAQLHRENDAQQQAIIAARHAEFRLCLRQQVTRATMINDERDEHHNDIGLPLYDCKPNLQGLAARRLTPCERRIFLRLARRRNNHLP